MGGGNAKISVEASTRGIATTLQKLQREQCGACLVFVRWVEVQSVEVTESRVNNIQKATRVL